MICKTWNHDNYYDLVIYSVAGIMIMVIYEGGGCLGVCIKKFTGFELLNV